jgi:RNA polymerase sigma-70 factor (ECF subfamily)
MPLQPAALTAPAIEPPATWSVADLQRGDARVLDACYRVHARRLYAIALRLTASPADAEDVVHDVFVRLPDALATYEERGQFAAWLTRLTVRTALLGRQRAVRRDQVHRQVDVPTDEPSEGDPVAYARALAALATLPERLRVVFVLRVIEGFAHAEIAALLAITVNTSEVRLHRALHQLRRLVGDLR